MKRIALSFALCALSASAAAGEKSLIEVSAAGRKVALKVEVMPASTERVAQAAERTVERDGVMVLPMPGSDYVLRTEKFNATGDVTTMAPASNPDASMSFSESMCTSRWTAGKRPHSFVSTIAKGEDMAEWSQRHQDALMMISSVYAPSGNAPALAAQTEAGNRDVAKTSWTDAMGNGHEVATKRGDVEDRDMFLARHRQAVEAFAALMQPKA